MITWVDRLKREYAQGKRILEAHRRSLNLEKIKDAEDAELVKGMIADLQFGINYMHTGRYPGAVRGIDRRSAYQRSIILDTELFPSLLDDPVSEKVLTDEEKRKLLNILCKLSIRERQCFILHAAYGLSYAKIAEELKLTKRSVQEYVVRARSKVQQGL